MKYLAYLFLISLVFIAGCGDSQTKEDIQCAVGGCSSQVCGNADEVKDLITTCEFKEEYQCLKYSECKPIEGKCQWEQTAEYKECLASL